MLPWTRHFEHLDGTHKRGQATEALLKAAFVVRDVPVLAPEYDNESYDFVIEVGSKFYKIQAKTAYRNTDATVRFETVSTRTRSDGYERDGYGGEIDYFAVYNPVCEESYLVHVDEAPKSKMEIRFAEPANNQRKGINWHEDHLLDATLDQLKQG